MFNISKRELPWNPKERKRLIKIGLISTFITYLVYSTGIRDFIFGAVEKIIPMDLMVGTVPVFILFFSFVFSIIIVWIRDTMKD